MITFKEFYKQHLIEMPEIRNWTQDHIKYDPGFRSDESLKRLFIRLHEDFEMSDSTKIHFYLNKKKFNAIGVIEKVNPITNTKSNFEICNVNFYHPNPASKLPDDIENPLQISQVYTDERYEAQGIATFLYILLAQLNYTIVSDKVQYLGGKHIWKKLSQRTKINDIEINVLQDGEYLKDDNSIIHYNGLNIIESDIWKTNTSGQKTILILRLRKEDYYDNI